MSIVIVGAGPNLGQAVARRFGRAGLSAGLISRNPEALASLVEQLRGEGLTASCATADIRDAGALQAAIAQLAAELGPVEVLSFSPLPAAEFMKPVLDTAVEEVRASLEFSVLGAVAAATSVLPAMLDAGRGTMLFTTGGAAINASPLRAGVGIAFGAEVTYAGMLHEQLRDQNVHVAHTAIVGRIGPGEAHEPDDVADLLWRHHVERQSFQTRLGF